MGFRFRKSINLGGSFKVNLSKLGVGYSWGTKGVRFTKTAKGRKRTTLSIPGTGISYVTESGGNHKSTKRSTKRATNNFTQPTYTPENPDNERGNHMAWIKFAICFFLGFFGVHKFMEKKTGMGLLYLFTMGLFGFGWLYDCGKYLIAAIKGTSFKANESNSPVEPAATVTANTTGNHPVELPAVDFKKMIKKVLLWVVTVFFALAALVYLTSGGVIAGLLAVAFVALVIPIDSWQNTVRKFIKGKMRAIIAVVLAILCFATVPAVEPTDVESTVPTTVATEPTETLAIEATAVTTEPETEATTEPPTEPATKPTTEPPTEPTTEPTTEPPTEPTTEPTTEPPTEPATKPTTEPTTAPTTEPATEATEPAYEGLTILSWPATISRNETGTVKIQGKPNTRYTITVVYNSGASTADGLEAKTSDSNGYVSWSWKVGGRTSAGTFEIVISGGGESKTVYFTVEE